MAPPAKLIAFRFWIPNTHNSRKPRHTIRKQNLSSRLRQIFRETLKKHFISSAMHNDKKGQSLIGWDEQTIEEVESCIGKRGSVSNMNIEMERPRCSWLMLQARWGLEWPRQGGGLGWRKKTTRRGWEGGSWPHTRLWPTEDWTLLFNIKVGGDDEDLGLSWESEKTETRTTSWMELTNVTSWVAGGSEKVATFFSAHLNFRAWFGKA